MKKSTSHVFQFQQNLCIFQLYPMFSAEFFVQTELEVIALLFAFYWPSNAIIFYYAISQKNGTRFCIVSPQAIERQVVLGSIFCQPKRRIRSSIGNTRRRQGIAKITFHCFVRRNSSILPSFQIIMHIAHGMQEQRQISLRVNPVIITKDGRQ